LLFLLYITQKVLHFGDDRELLSGALNRKHTFLAGRASEHGPDLPKGGAGDRDAADGDEVVAPLNSVTALGYRRFAVIIGDPENSEASVVFGTQNQPHDVEVREIEQAADVEIDGGVSVVDADAIVEERLGA